MAARRLGLKDPPPAYAFFAIARCSSWGSPPLRAFEVAGLTLADTVKLRQGQLHVTGKGGDEYLHVIDGVALEALGAWLEARPVCRFPFVFVQIPPGRREAGLHPATVERLIKTVYLAAGVESPSNRPFHALRHAVGFRMGNRGVALQIIQDYLRHKNPATTRIYARVDPETIRETIRREVQFPTRRRRS